MTQSFLLKNLSEITTISPNEITQPCAFTANSLQTKIQVLFPNHIAYLTPLSATCKKIIGLKLYACIILTLGLIFLSQDFCLSYALYKRSQKITLLPFSSQPTDNTREQEPTVLLGTSPPPTSTYPDLRVGLFSPEDGPFSDSSSPSGRLQTSPIPPTGSNILATQASSRGNHQEIPLLPPSPPDSSYLTGQPTVLSKTITSDHKENSSLADVSCNLSDLFASTLSPPGHLNRSARSIIHSFEPMKLSDPIDPQVLEVITKLRPHASKDLRCAWAGSISILHKILADFDSATLQTMLNFWTTGSMASIIKKDKSVSSASPAYQVSSSDVDSLVNKNKSSLTDQNFAHIGLYFSTPDENSLLPGEVLLQYFYTLYVSIIQLGAMSHDELKEWLAFEQAFVKCINFESLQTQDPYTTHQNEYNNTKELGQAAYNWLRKIKQTDYHCGSVLKAVLKIAILLDSLKKSRIDQETLFENTIQFLELYQKPS